MDAASKLVLGFDYTIEILKPPRWLPRALHHRAWVKWLYRVTDTETVHNIIPTQGLNHFLSVVCNTGTQVTTWFVGMFEANYTPVATDTMAAFPAAATECTAYTESVRQTWVESTPAGGVTTNVASKAEFNMNATKTLFGAFLSSSPVKSGITGTLLSAAKFSASKAVDSGDIARITASLTLTSS